MSLASWAAKKESVKLQVDWKSLGLDPARMECVAPEIRDFQPAGKFSNAADIPVEPGHGWLLILRSTKVERP